MLYAISLDFLGCSHLPEKRLDGNAIFLFGRFDGDQCGGIDGVISAKELFANSLFYLKKGRLIGFLHLDSNFFEILAEDGFIMKETISVQIACRV